MASSSALFLAPDANASMFFFPNPEALPDWTKPEPAYDHIFVVRINSANPAAYRAEVREIPLASVKRQADLDQTHLKLAEDSRYALPGANSGFNLDLKLRSGMGALVIFHLSDPNATFVDADAQGRPSHGVVKAEGDPDLIFQARWVKGNEGDREAVSVILKGVPEGKGWLQQYGLGVRIRNDDPHGPGTSDIIIDPKVENEGEGMIDPQPQD